MANQSRTPKRRGGGNRSEYNAAQTKKRVRRDPLDLTRTHDNQNDDVVQSSDEDVDAKDNVSSSEEEEDDEDLEAKKVRLARQYLQKLEEKTSDDEEHEDDDDEDDGDADEDRVGRALQRTRLEREGAYESDEADKLATRIESMRIHVESSRPQQPMSASWSTEEQEAKAWVAAGHVRLLRGHDMTPTSVALQLDGSRAISGAKDHSAILWDIETEKKLEYICTHYRKAEDQSTLARTAGQVLSVACSDDGRYAAVGTRDGQVRIFDIRTARDSSSAAMVKEFTGHKAAISSLAFRSNTHQLFSASEDRCIRHYNLQEMIFLETLYGHQFGVSEIDCYRKERPVSVGRDRTVRAWKLSEDTHLIFRGGSRIQSAESVSMIKDDWFLTGHEDGHLALWTTEKKKTVARVTAAHGCLPNGLERGVVCVKALRASDVALSGSSDGYLRFWKTRTGRSLRERGLDEVRKIPIHGYINGIAVGPKGQFAVLAVGNEHKLGRWEKVKRAKNRLAIVSLRQVEAPEESSSKESGSEED